jgi:imidazolonepropionase-like amidohydrolase
MSSFFYARRVGSNPAHASVCAPVVLASLASLGSLAIAASSLASASDKQSDPSQDKDSPHGWVVFAEHIYTASGRVVDKGMVTVNNGKISAVTPGRDEALPKDTLKAFAVTPGLIDASVRIDSGLESVEQSREISPDTRVADTLDLYSIDWDRQVRSGVTTVLATAPDYDVIGGLGVVLKTGGKESIAARTVKSDAVLRGSMGSQPSEGNHPAFGRPTDFYSRRPTTRMGVEWEWRKAFFDTAAAQRDSSRAFPGSDKLLAVMKGELTLSIQAWTTQDIRTAVFLKEEIERDLGAHPRMFIDAAAEAWKEPQLLVRSKTPVVLPPFPAGGRTAEGAFMAWNVAEQLREQGVLIALSSHGSENLEARLAMQAGYAMRGGLMPTEQEQKNGVPPLEYALEAVTINPARLLGVENRVGTLEVGKDADLVLWNGPPFEPSSRIIGVVLDGVLKVDPRPRE